MKIIARFIGTEAPTEWTTSKPVVISRGLDEDGFVEEQVEVYVDDDKGLTSFPLSCLRRIEP